MTKEPAPPLSCLSLHEWACLRTELVWIYDQPVLAQHRSWKADHAEVNAGYRAWFIRRGSVLFTSGTRRISVGFGQWVTPPQGSETQFSDDAHIISLRFFCHWPSGEGVLTGTGGLVLNGDQYPELEQLALNLHSCLQREFPDLSRSEYVYSQRASCFDGFLTIQGLFLAWLQKWFRSQIECGAQPTRTTRGDDRPFRAARLLNQAKLDEKFPIDRLNRETGLGTLRLNQLFLSQFGVTLRKYWDRRRLDFAKRCLEASHMPLKEIAFSLGFRSDSNFVVWFRSKTGSRPSEYRVSFY